MLTLDDLHGYQREAVEWMAANERGFLWLARGDGKTVISATAILDGCTRPDARAIVVGTKRIVEHVWPRELTSWKHLSSLSYRSAVGAKRNRENAIKANPQILGVSYENLLWYLGTGDGATRSFWIFDEITKMKSHATKRFRALRSFLRDHQPEKMYGLTATPTMQGHQGLWSQWKSIGADDRIGARITDFRRLYMNEYFRGQYSEFVMNPSQCLRVEEQIRDHVFTIDPSRRPYTGVPEIIDVEIPWTSAGRDRYRRAEKALVVDLEERSFAAVNQGAARNKCRQLATGFVFDEEKNVHWFDQDKLDAVAEAVEELQGEQCLVFYNFVPEKEALLDLLPDAEPLDNDSLDRFNKGELQTLVLHPKSCSHGLNLQSSRYALFCSVPDSAEEFVQAVGRVNRQGQTRQPVVMRFNRELSVDREVRENADGRVLNQSETIARLRERTI